MESLNSNSQERELYQLQQMQHKAKESCMKSFRLLQSHLQVLSYNDLKINGCFERAFVTLFEQDVQTFTGIMLLNLDQLEKQLDKDEFQGDRSMVAFCMINKQFQMFIDSQLTWDYDSQMTEKYFDEYTGIEVKQFRETLLLHMGNVKKSLAERTRHKRQYDRRENERQMRSRESKVVSSKALDASLVVIECGRTKSDEHITSSSSGTYITHAVDADIIPVNDQVPFAEVESNTTPDSTNMCHVGGEIDQDAEQYQAKSPLLKAELVKSKEMIEKETYNELSRRNSKKVSYGSNDMAHNHYLEEARKKAQEINRNSKPSVMHTTSLQNTTNGSKPNPRSNNQISRSLPLSKSSCGISNGVSLKSSAVHEKSNTPRSCLRWKPTGRIFKIAGLRWIPTGKMFTDNTTRVDSEPLNGSIDDITNSYECDQTLNVSAGLALQRQMAYVDNTSGPAPQRKERCTLQCTLSLEEEKSSYLRAVLSTTSIRLMQNIVSSTPYVLPSKKDYEILFQPLFDEYFNPPPRAVSLDPVAVAAQELLIQSVQLRQLPLIKMYHLLVLHQQIRKFNLKSFFKVLKK
ncbi:hypothetical protein Tco_1395041 [Tanacetum coccineum]